MRASVIPSARYSWVGSPERFFKGNTAREVMGGCLLALVPLRFSTKPMVSSANEAVTPSTTFRRVEAVLFSAGKSAGSEANGACDAGCTRGYESPLLQVMGATK